MKKFYAVKIGRIPGIYFTWDECKKQIFKFPGAKYKSFPNRLEAESFLKDEISTPASPSKTLLSLFKPNNTKSESTLTQPVGTKRKVEQNDEPIKKLKLEKIVVYTDGSALGNGKSGAKAGIGVWFGPDDSRNISESLEGPRQTNQRAEITAAIRALEVISKDKAVEIRSDSQYLIKCMTEWIHKWRRNNFNNDTVQNKDLIQKLDKIIQSRTEPTNFVYVKAHSGVQGNEGADQLAVAGSLKNTI